MNDNRNVYIEILRIHEFMEPEVDFFLEGLPPRSNNKQIDIETLRYLWFKTIKDAIKELSTISPSNELKLIYKLEENGNLCSYEAEIPRYLVDVSNKRRSEIGEKVGNEFVNYLWDCGRPKFRISDPTKLNWGYWVLSKFVFGPILHMLNDGAIYQLVDGKKIKPWFIADTQVAEYISEASFAFVNNKYIVHAYCPIYGIRLNGFQYAKISEHTTLRNYTPRDISIFLSKYSSVESRNL